MFHSDRGFQYTREVFKNTLKESRFRQSMSRVLRCIDNGPMESFQRIMKDEIKRLYNYKIVDEFKKALQSSQLKQYPMLINYEVKNIETL